jgi:hypothetical protein
MRVSGNILKNSTQATEKTEKKFKKMIFSYAIERGYFNFSDLCIHYQKVNPGLLLIDILYGLQ